MMNPQKNPVKLPENLWEGLIRPFLRDNYDWLLACLGLAMFIWFIAVQQTNPIEEREYQEIDITFLLDENTVMTTTPSEETVNVRLRAPSQTLETLSVRHIEVVVDLRGRGDGEMSIPIEVDLSDDIQGRVVAVTPDEVTVTLSQLATQRIPIATPVIVQPPPSGYANDPPTCSLTEVTARGPVARLEGLSAVVRLNLSEERNPISLTADLVAVNTEGRTVRNVELTPAQVTCQVNIRPIDNVAELSVLPVVGGFPASGYIYEGFTFTPTTVVVTGSPAAIREMNGVVETENISLNGATEDFEQTVNLVLPTGVRLMPASQTVTVEIQIGTVRSSRQYMNIPITIEGLGEGLSAQLLPNSVTVFLVGPQPILSGLDSAELRVVVDVTGLAAGDYLRPLTVSVVDVDLSSEEISLSDLSLTVQPEEINVIISEGVESTLTPPPTPQSD